MAASSRGGSDGRIVVSFRAVIPLVIYAVVFSSFLLFRASVCSTYPEKCFPCQKDPGHPVSANYYHRKDTHTVRGLNPGDGLATVMHLDINDYHGDNKKTAETGFYENTNLQTDQAGKLKRRKRRSIHANSNILQRLAKLEHPQQ